MTTAKGVFRNDELISAYGPQGYAYPVKAELLSYAKSLSWLSRNVDPTGLIWMGARYYDPIVGRFISQDPVGRPVCMDLYAYAGGDPINFYDPDGNSCFGCAEYWRVCVLEKLFQKEKIKERILQGLDFFF